MTVTEASPPPTDLARGLRRTAHVLGRFGALVVAAGLFVTLSLVSDAFLTSTNLANLVQQWAFIGIIACTVTILMVAGAFDLSVGANFALSGVVAAMVAATSVSAGLLAGVACGAVVGVINGFLVGYAGVNSFLATLASGFILRGVALTLTGGLLITVREQSFTELGRGELLGFPLINWLFLAVAAASALLLHRSIFGRQVFATGANPEAAYLAGVNVRRTTWLAYVLAGTAAGVAGVLAASQAGTGQAGAGAGYELLVVAAVVLGGTSITGGTGAVWRSVIGTLVLGMIANGSNLLGLTSTVQQIIQGSIILLAVVVDRFAHRAKL